VLIVVVTEVGTSGILAALMMTSKDRALKPRLFLAYTLNL